MENIKTKFFLFYKINMINIIYQPEEILLNIFKYVNYQDNLYYVCQRFRQIIQIIDAVNINRLITNINLYNIVQINRTLKNTFILNNIYSFYNFNIVDIGETLYDIERIHIYNVLKSIKFKYKIAVDDIQKFISIVMKYYNNDEFYIARKVFVELPNIGAMLVLCNSDLIKIINFIKINLTENYLQYYKIISLSGKDFCYINEDDYSLYYNQILCNIEYIQNMRSNIIFNQRIVLAKRYERFYNMIKKSKKFKIHFNAIKIVCLNI